jgi:cysteine desulfurase
MHTALQASLNNMEFENAHILNLKKHLISKLKTEMEGVLFNGNCEDLEKSMVSLVSARFPSLPKDNMHLFTLDMQGIALSGGSACTSGSQQGSHVIQAIYANNEYPVIRFSIGKDNTIEEIGLVVDALKKMEVPATIKA